MTIEEIDNIHPLLHKVLDLNECETDFEIINISELNSSDEYSIGLQRKYSSKKYRLFIIGNNWEIYSDNDSNSNPISFTPLLKGDISTLRYREK